jgi:hypothetical protein
MTTPPSVPVVVSTWDVAGRPKDTSASVGRSELDREEEYGYERCLAAIIRTWNYLI